MLRQMTEREARFLLASGRVGRLGCLFDGGPYVVPVSYIFHEDRLYMHSRPGRKIAALRSNPRACLQVDEIRDEYQWRSAIAFGDYHEVMSSPDRDRALADLLKRFPHLTPADSVALPDEGSPAVVFYIQVKELTGVGEW